VILARGNDLVAQLLQERADPGGGQRRRTKFRAHQFEDQGLRQAAQVDLRRFSLLRSVMGHGAKQRAHGAAAGALHRGVDGTGRFFCGESAGHFHRRRQTPDQA
jgi:hypothetical protein